MEQKSHTQTDQQSQGCLGLLLRFLPEKFRGSILALAVQETSDSKNQTEAADKLEELKTELAGTLARALKEAQESGIFSGLLAPRQICEIFDGNSHHDGVQMPLADLQWKNFDSNLQPLIELVTKVYQVEINQVAQKILAHYQQRIASSVGNDAFHDQYALKLNIAGNGMTGQIVAIMGLKKFCAQLDDASNSLDVDGGKSIVVAFDLAAADRDVVGQLWSRLKSGTSTGKSLIQVVFKPAHADPEQWPEKLKNAVDAGHSALWNSEYGNKLNFVPPLVIAVTDNSGLNSVFAANFKEVDQVQTQSSSTDQLIATYCHEWMKKAGLTEQIRQIVGENVDLVTLFILIGSIEQRLSASGLTPEISEINNIRQKNQQVGLAPQFLEQMLKNLILVKSRREYTHIKEPSNFQHQLQILLTLARNLAPGQLELTITDEILAQLTLNPQAAENEIKTANKDFWIKYLNPIQYDRSTKIFKFTDLTFLNLLLSLAQQEVRFESPLKTNTSESVKSQLICGFCGRCIILP